MWEGRKKQMKDLRVARPLQLLAEIVMGQAVVVWMSMSLGPIQSHHLVAGRSCRALFAACYGAAEWSVLGDTCLRGNDAERNHVRPCSKRRSISSVPRRHCGFVTAVWLE